MAEKKSEQGINELNSIQIFNFANNEITTILGQDGEPWWLAAEVCQVIGIGNVSMAMSRLDADEKSTISPADGAGGPHRHIINETGIYSLAFRSEKPEAKKFCKWVKKEVLPQIRKTGSYVAEVQDPRVAQAKLLLQVIEGQVQAEQRLTALEATSQAVEAQVDKALEVAQGAAHRADAAHLAITNASGWYSTMGFSRLLGLKVPLPHQAAIGKKATAICGQLGIKPQPLHDPRFGTVNSYPEEILEGLKTEFIARSSAPKAAPVAA